ncbi:MAG TPA: hypothetical protein VH877_13050 [Polyangia bacterium]|nr:hypothetical protein [Polyangia bacterium]
MGIIETALIYGLLGAVVAAALALRSERVHPLHRAGQALVWLLLWPLFAPLLLGGGREVGGRPAPASATGVGARPGLRSGAALDPRLNAAEERLLGALGRLGGVTHTLLAPEIERLRALTGALGGLAKRLVEMDALLGSPEFDARQAAATLEDLLRRGHGDDDARVESVKNRLRNIARLQEMHRRTGEQLERALLKMEEMSSQLLLLQFAEGPEVDVVERVREIAASVDGLSEGWLAAA